jgi:hypothetical protein
MLAGSTDTKGAMSRSEMRWHQVAPVFMSIDFNWLEFMQSWHYKGSLYKTQVNPRGCEVM